MDILRYKYSLLSNTKINMLVEYIELCQKIISELLDLKIVSLHLEHKGLSEIPNIPYKNLKYLYLQDNKLTDVSQLSKLTELVSLNISSNKISNIPDFPESLLYLYLSNNNISRLPTSFSNLINLQILYLNGNQLSEIPPEIYNLSQIWMLDLSDNKITVIPSQIKLLYNLQNLNLHGNLIKKFPYEITEIPLKFLNISKNPLTDLPDISQMNNLITITIDKGTSIKKYQEWISYINFV